MFQRPSPRARRSRYLDAKLRSRLFTRFCTRGCPKTVISTTFPEFTMSTVSRTWFIHSISGTLARSGPKQKNRESRGRHGPRSRGSRFEGNVVRGREELEVGIMASNVASEFVKDLGELPCQAPLRLEGAKPPARLGSLTKDRVSQPCLQVKHQRVSQFLHRKPPRPGANLRQWRWHPQQPVQGLGGHPLITLDSSAWLAGHARTSSPGARRVSARGTPVRAKAAPSFCGFQQAPAPALPGVPPPAQLTLRAARRRSGALRALQQSPGLPFHHRISVWLQLGLRVFRRHLWQVRYQPPRTLPPHTAD